MGALKDNHPNFFNAIKEQFQSDSHFHSVETGHGRVERRSVSLWQSFKDLPQQEEWAGLKSIIRVTSYRHILKGKYLLIKQPHIRYFISSLSETVEQFAQRLRDYWHIENKVHYVRDVTQGEDLSRIRVHPLPNIFASARNIALNLYRDQGFNNVAQAQRKAGQELELLKTLFRMK